MLKDINLSIELSPEALLNQLGYSNTPKTVEQMRKIIKNTKNFHKFSGHLLALHDNLAPLKGFVAMSNSYDNLKVKCSSDISKDIEEEFREKVEKWAKKYKVEIKKVENKPTYYILGS